jgi:predicted nucleic acid-binding protein
VKFTCDTNVLVDVLRDASAEEAFRVFLTRFSHFTYLSSVVVLELRAGARTTKQARLLEQKVIQRFARVDRVFTPSADAFSTAGSVLASLATRDRRTGRLRAGWLVTKAA